MLSSSLLSSLWVRYTAVLAVSVAGLLVGGSDLLAWVGAVMWAMTAVACLVKVNDRAAIMGTALKFILGYSVIPLAVALTQRFLDLTSLVESFGIPPADAPTVAAGWARNTALSIMGIGFLIPVYFVWWWGQAMFFDRPSTFFSPVTTVEEAQAIIKRGGRWMKEGK